MAARNGHILRVYVQLRCLPYSSINSRCQTIKIRVRSYLFYDMRRNDDVVVGCGRSACFSVFLEISRLPLQSCAVVYEYLLMRFFSGNKFWCIFCGLACMYKYCLFTCRGYLVNGERKQHCHQAYTFMSRDTVVLSCRKHQARRTQHVRTWHTSCIHTYMRWMRHRRQAAERQGRDANIKLTFSWSNFLSSVISRRIRFASTRSSNALVIFLMATFCPVSVLSADITTPYAPCPIGLISSYLASTWIKDRIQNVYV